MKTNRIVCPVDFSEESHAALELASQLARADGAKLYIVHVEETSSVVQPGIFGGLPPISWRDRQILDAIAPTEKGVSYEHALLIGNPAEEIVSFAGRKEADLIVMGTHGRNGLVRAVMGSVAEAVVRRSPIPVLTIKATAQDPELSTA